MTSGHHHSVGELTTSSVGHDKRKTKTMNINEVYTTSGGFLKASDLGNSKPVVTISGIEMTERDYNDGQGVKKQLVLSFYDKEKKLGLNRTNAARLAELTGSEDTDDWLNVTIKLFVEQVQVGNEKKAAIRIFPELPDQKPEPPKSAKGDFTGKRGSDPDDDDSFAF